MENEDLVCINIPEAKVDRAPHTWEEIAAEVKNNRNRIQ
jgi:hypothetical protein